MKTPAALAPSMTLGQLTSLIRRAQIFIAGDTGPMHIAWTVGTPVVAIYGPTDPDLNLPGGLFSTVAYEKVFCSPCRNRGCIARTCLERLPPERVADSAVGVLQRAAAARVGRGLGGAVGT
jgi:ADP-heptose:LPS heptosyltransferase